MIDGFFLPIILAALGVALAAGPLGCFVLWRRMVYFGDTISHGALLGVALALATEIPVIYGILLVAMGLSLLVVSAGGRALHTDTLLGVSAHSALAIGLLATSLLDGVSVNLMNYLTGDILAVTWADVGLIWVGAGASLGLLAWRWQRLLLSSLSGDIASARGIAPRRESLIFALALALLVAVAIKVVGALLITALLIIPAASGRLGAGSPGRMVVLAACAGGAAALLGLGASLRFDTPTGPTIVVAALMILLLASLLRTLVSRLSAGKI